MKSAFPITYNCLERVLGPYPNELLNITQLSGTFNAISYAMAKKVTNCSGYAKLAASKKELADTDIDGSDLNPTGRKYADIAGTLLARKCTSSRQASDTADEIRACILMMEANAKTILQYDEPYSENANENRIIRGEAFSILKEKMERLFPNSAEHLAKLAPKTLPIDNNEETIVFTNGNFVITLRARAHADNISNEREPEVCKDPSGEILRENLKSMFPDIKFHTNKNSKNDRPDNARSKNEETTSVYSFGLTKEVEELHRINMEEIEEMMRNNPLTSTDSEAERKIEKERKKASRERRAERMKARERKELSLTPEITQNAFLNTEFGGTHALANEIAEITKGICVGLNILDLERPYYTMPRREDWINDPNEVD